MARESRPVAVRRVANCYNPFPLPYLCLTLSHNLTTPTGHEAAYLALVISDSACANYYLLDRIAAPVLDANYCCRSSAVCVFVDLFDTTTKRCAETDEPIEVPLGKRTRVRPRIHVLGGYPDPPMVRRRRCGPLLE